MRIILSAIALMVVASCSDSPHRPTGVTPDAYLDLKSCWIGNDDRLTAFLILVQSPNGFRTYFVSSRCYVSEFGGDTTMGYLGAFMVAGDTSALKSLAGLTGDMLPNTETDARPPADRSRVYLFKGALADHPVAGYPDARVYDIARVESLIDTKISFGRFRRLTSDERFALFQTSSRVR